MIPTIRQITFLVFTLACTPACVGQIPAKTPTSDFASMARRASGLAERGLCREALPLLQKAAPKIADRQLRYKAAFNRAQCAMSLEQRDAVFEALAQLHRDFPGDPHVLYVTAQYCSILAERAAKELAENAPTSYQALQLEAEAFEAHGQWAKAEAEYRKILERYPELPNIHYRLARIILAKPSTATTVADAQAELEAELKTDSNHAATEFLLGDLARQQQHWDNAILHFAQATRLDAGFAEAHLGLGIALSAAGRYAEAIRPLETYVKSQPEDPAGHHQLAMAYARAGRKEDAAREMLRQRELDERVHKEKNP